MIFALATAAGFYWEFLRDIDADEAFAYYRQQTELAETDNALRAYAGIAAPAQTTNAETWAYVEITRNRERHRRGEAVQPLLGDRAADDGRLYLRLPAAGRHFACWLPSGSGDSASPGCIERDEMLALLEQNRLLLQRYRRVFDHAGIYFRKQDRIGFDLSHQLSRLLAVDLWLRRESLASADVELLFDFFRFWERQARYALLSLTDTTMSIVNYDIAANLLSRLSQRQPDLLLRYHARHGEFTDHGFTADNYDALVRADFRSMNQEFCFFPQLVGLTDSCEAPGGNLYYKPGRTVQLLYDLRLRPEHCGHGNRARQVNTEAVDSDFWTYLFSRPGNFRGRGIARLASGAMRKVCVLLDGIDVHAQQNRLRNLYVYFRRNGYAAEAIETRLQDLMREHRGRGGRSSFSWHAERGELVWEAPAGAARYRLAYRPDQGQAPE